MGLEHFEQVLPLSLPRWVDTTGQYVMELESGRYSGTFVPTSIECSSADLSSLRSVSSSVVREDIVWWACPTKLV